ncbi:tyrosine-type recombinase/integrase [Pedobacter sp. MC2016-14]|uniref:tyrosine-type recombinase/integrase n=1 Tax=Pedobacter sp. MC2016-14 TaxID=2897327 RepID=UPI00351CD166
MTYLEHEKRYSPHTIEAYRTDLLQFEQYVLGTFEMDLASVAHDQVRNYIATLMEDHIGANSIGRKLSALRSFYKFLRRTAVLSVNPMVLIKAPRVTKPLPVFVDEKKMDELLDSDVFFDDSFPSVRDKMVMETFFGTGIRLAELVGLKDTDLNSYDASLKVLGKGNKERIIPITKSLVNQLSAYISLKDAQNFTNKSAHLFVSNKGTSVTHPMIYKIVRQYLSYVSTQDKRSPHVLRHSYATSLLNRGADINAIKELLGHASLAATQVYTHNSIERLKLIYKQAHPKA